MLDVMRIDWLRPFAVHPDADVPSVTHFSLPALKPLLIHTTAHSKRVSHYKNVC